MSESESTSFHQGVILAPKEGLKNHDRPHSLHPIQLLEDPTNRERVKVEYQGYVRTIDIDGRPVQVPVPGPKRLLLTRHLPTRYRLATPEEVAVFTASKSPEFPAPQVPLNPSVPWQAHLILKFNPNPTLNTTFVQLSQQEKRWFLALHNSKFNTVAARARALGISRQSYYRKVLAMIGRLITAFGGRASYEDACKHMDLPILPVIT